MRIRVRNVIQHNYLHVKKKNYWLDRCPYILFRLLTSLLYDIGWQVLLTKTRKLQVLPSACGITTRESYRLETRERAREKDRGGGKFVTNSFVSSTPQNEQLERKRFQTATRRWWAAESHGEPRRDEEREQRGSSRLRNLFCSHVCSLRESRKPGTPMQAGPHACKIRDSMGTDETRAHAGI